MNQSTICRGKFTSHLPDCFKERHALNITDCSPDFNDADVSRFPVKDLLFCSRSDTILDLVGDMRNYLNCLTQVVTTTFLVDDHPVHFTGGDIMGGVEFDI
ncbi:MAG: hypothetical protein BWY45_03393 [Euryarchaeota archaeon ADurb.Bin294]|nr:MAG: hypothetical protein BWY45_03393 [Euryarchaeota archaeon ADurb.Bin294]